MTWWHHKQRKCISRSVTGGRGWTLKGQCTGMGKDRRHAGALNARIKGLGFLPKQWGAPGNLRAEQGRSLTGTLTGSHAEDRSEEEEASSEEAVGKGSEA